MAVKKLLLFFILSLSYLTIAAQNWLWSRNGIGDAAVWSTKTDGYGNCYLIGQIPNDTVHFGSCTFRNSTLTNPPYSNYVDPFIVKYDSHGNLLWGKQWTCEDTSKFHVTFSPATGAVGANGSVYMYSNYTDTVIVGPYTEVSPYGYGHQSVCVAKYDSNGNVKWVRTSKCSHTDTNAVVAQYISCDKFGNVFLLAVGGYDTIYFGSQALYFNHSVYDHSILVKYDSNGNVKWAKHSNGLTINSNDNSFGIANDNYGNTFLTGAFFDTVQFGAFTLIANVQGNVELVKYDSSGNVLWARQSLMAGSSPFISSGGVGVTTDRVGNVYVCGDFQDTLILGQDSLKNQDYANSTFFVAKYDPNGNVLWAKFAAVLDSNNWNAISISSDNHNHIFISANGGHGKNKIAFGGDTLTLFDTARNDGASVIFKLDSNGKALCSTIIPCGPLNGGFYSVISSDTSGKYVYYGSQTATVAMFGKDTINPFAYPLNHTQGLNFFPFAARWEACDSSILLPVTEQKTLSNGQIVVYPNPNSGNFIIALQNVNEPAQVVIYNVMGEKVQSEKLNAKNTGIEMTGKASGIYFYRVLKEDGGLIGSGKVVIEK